MAELLTTRKDVAVAIGRARSFATDLCRAGLKLPTTKEQVLTFWRLHPNPSTTRPNYRRKKNE